MNEIKKLWDKINLNSFYPAHGCHYFMLYDEDIAVNIRNNAREILLEIQNKIGDEDKIQNGE